MHFGAPQAGVKGAPFHSTRIKGVQSHFSPPSSPLRVPDLYRADTPQLLPLLLPVRADAP